MSYLSGKPTISYYSALIDMPCRKDIPKVDQHRSIDWLELFNEWRRNSKNKKDEMCYSECVKVIEKILEFDGMVGRVENIHSVLGNSIRIMASFCEIEQLAAFNKAIKQE